MTNFFNKTFNLAGILRGFFAGLVIALAVALILTLFQLNGADWFYVLIFLLLPISGAVLGLQEKPKGQNSKFLSGWINFTRAVSFMSLFTSKVIPPDGIIPEKVTVKDFLIILGFIAVVMILLFKLA
jgi:hypothetical protein